MIEFIENNLITILGYLLGTGGIFSAWSERRKRKINALSGMQAAYDKYVEDSDKKFEEMRGEIASLKSDLVKVEASWKQKYKALKSDFDQYRKKHP